MALQCFSMLSVLSKYAPRFLTYGVSCIMLPPNEILKSVSSFVLCFGAKIICSVLSWFSLINLNTNQIVIVKSLIISLIGYEIEIRGIPENYYKIINNLIWEFIWNNKVNQVDRNVCGMDIEEGGLEIIYLFSFVKSKQIKVLYKIMHSGNETWSALGNYWLNKFDKDTGEDFFLCK